jgi:acetoin:2,6-dichlorophenolindophenol oxidoreductase subunit beta
MNRTLSYREAITEALAQEMRRDPRVFVYGIDVADHKRIFNSSKGLVEEFGTQRCFSTPLSEDAMTGFGFGAALNGLRPVHVHMRVDFFLLGVNQLVNMIASHRYGTGGKFSVPMVIRAIIGRGWGQSFQHSKTLHSWFAHIPGLKVVMPATPRDAKEMLVAAIREENPVVSIEHRWLYDAEGEVPEDNSVLTDLGKAQVLRKGTDLTIVATSWMNVEAMKAAEILAERQNISLEVVDARSISPFDRETVIQSVEKTGYCLVADNDWLHCGFSAEVAAQVSEFCFGKLEKPVSRMGFAAAHCPCTRPLEDRFYPNAITIIREVERILELSETDLTGVDFYSYENKFKGPF